MKNILITLVLLAFTSLSLSAQFQLSGKITDAQHKILSYVNVLLLSPNDSSLIQGTITDDLGNFALENVLNGTYNLSVSFIGYENFTTSVVVGGDKKMYPIVLSETSQSLDEVTVTTKRKLIHRKIDRLIFDVENSTKAREGDALDVLRVTPGVRVMNDEISMIGKNRLSVMINGKMMQLTEEDLASFLKSISSEDIKNIEVITTPPAKYEAEGNSGLINIQLKKAKANSWNALLKSSYLQRTYATGSGGVNFNYNRNGFSLASSFNYSDGIYYQEQDDYAYFPDGLWYTYSPFKSDYSRLNARIDLGYEINSRWTIGAQYLHNKNTYYVTDTPYLPVFSNETNGITRYLQSESIMDIQPVFHSLNLNNEFTIDSLGKKVTLNFDYFTYDNPDEKMYSGISVIKNPEVKQYFAGTNTNQQGITNWSGKLDVDFPTPSMNLSFGGKISTSESLNDILFYNSGLVENPVTNLPLAENDFKYLENVQAIYLSGNKKINAKWEMQFGLRMEATQTESISEYSNVNNKSNYMKLFPTFYLAHSANENSTYALNYSRRIARPNFFQLNPNTYFINAFQTINGNPFLQPAFIDNIELSFSHKNFSSKIYFSHEENLFEQVPLPNSATNEIRFTQENFIDADRVGLSLNHTFDKLKWWTTSNSADVNYSTSKFNLPVPQADLKGVNAMISTSNDFTITKNRDLLFNVNLWYSFPGIEGVFKTKSASSLSLSLHYFLFDKDLRISLKGNDIFKNQALRWTTDTGGVYQTARYYFDSRSVQLAVSYRFGNKDIQAKKHRTGNSDERGRTGN